MDTDGPTDVRRTFKNFYFLEVEGNFWDTFLKAEPGTSFCQLGLMDLKHTFEICHSAFCTPHSLNINRAMACFSPSFLAVSFVGPHLFPQFLKIIRLSHNHVDDSGLVSIHL